MVIADPIVDLATQFTPPFSFVYPLDRAGVCKMYQAVPEPPASYARRDFTAVEKIKPVIKSRRRKFEIKAVAGVPRESSGVSDGLLGASGASRSDSRPEDEFHQRGHKEYADSFGPGIYCHISHSKRQRQRPLGPGIVIGLSVQSEELLRLSASELTMGRSGAGF